MSNADNENEKDLAFDLIENPIVAHTQAVKVIFASDLLNSSRVGILRERINPLFNPSPYRSVEGFEVSSRPRCKLYPVRQLDAQLFLDLLPRYGAFFLHLGKCFPRLFQVDPVFQGF